MKLRDRLMAVLAIVLFVAVAALAISFFLVVAAVVLAVGTILALILYVRLRLAVRKFRRALADAAQTAGNRPQQSPGPGSAAESIDADFKVDDD